ncbi:AraC family transcriptional regulator [Microbacterium sp. LWO13-1.2]|uniref:helix-turn-helix transcriptional regulator n=1 Tax=Microbacterium sp. LWO13-1.2 TaxID=3135262 RepID=UPI00313914E6
MSDWSRYAHPAPAFADRAIVCIGAGEYRGNDSEVRDRPLRSHAAVVVSEGSGWFRSQLSTDVAIEAPALIWLFPGIRHSYGPDRSGWTEHWVLFGGTVTRDLDALPAWSPATPVVQLGAVPATLAPTFTRLRSDLAEPGSVGALRASAICYSWLVDLAASAKPAGAPDLVAAFARGATRQVSMEARARELGVSLAELRAETLTATGLTPLQLLIESRLARAQSLLVESDLEVGVIGKTVGFDDPAYFSRQFTRRRGSSPSMFRSEQRRVPSETGEEQ